MASNNTVILKGRGERVERVPAAAFTPGHLIEYTSDDKFQKHATAGGAAAPIFAVENEVFGKDLNAAYATTDMALAEHCYSGMEVNALVATAAPAIVIGDHLESAGDGTLRKVTTGIAIAIALEALTNTSGSDARLRVAVL